jgi:isoleucyl-tRNA synthetase
MSNWYVRLSRRRFWKGTDDRDKQNAYRTFFESLATLNAVLAPALPFSAEEVYQKIVLPARPDGPESVHLCDFPDVREDLVDAELEARMGRVMQLVNLALSARAASNIKVRQPLALARFALPDAGEREALEAYTDLITQEINVKKIEFVDSNDDLLDRSVRPNLSVLGKRFGKRTQAVKEALRALDPVAAQTALDEDGSVEIRLADADGEEEAFTVGADAFEVETAGREGWLLHAEGDVSAALDGRLTDDLVVEGRARDLVRHIQNHRKSAGLDVADRIHVTYAPKGLLAEAMEAESDYIAGEVLALTLMPLEKPEGEYRGEIRIGKEVLPIGIRKAKED